MEKEIKIEYQPTIENLMKVSKYLLLNLPFVKYFAPAFTVLFLFSNILNVILNNKTILKDSLMQFGMITLIGFVFYFSIMP